MARLGMTPDQLDELPYYILVRLRRYVAHYDVARARLLGWH